MRTVFVLPPLSKGSGGLASLVELALILAEQGRGVAAAVPGGGDCGGIPGGNALRDAGVPFLPWPGQGEKVAKDDLWCVPEGWPNAMLPAVEAGARVLVYVQNWAFMLTPLPGRVPWKRLPAAYLAVSEPVRWFLGHVLGLESSGLLPPSVHPDFFRPGARSAKRIRVAWMPRKNKALGRQIQDIALARLAAQGQDQGVEFVAIEGLERAAVASIMGASHIFVSTGFPEGFALPPIEAMASGCVPVGFSGLGGFAYMRNPGDAALPFLHSPSFLLEEKPWGGNGFFVADGDVLGAGLALAHAVRMARENNAAWESMAENGRRAASAYSLEQRKIAAAALWDGFEGSQRSARG